MGLARNTPIFLDYVSGYTKEQVDTINLIVRTARRNFESKAKQKQKEAPTISKLISKKYGRVLDLKDYLYNKNFSIHFILNPVNFELNGVYNIFETDKHITSLQFGGSNSSSKVEASLGSLGYFSVSRIADTGKEVCTFHVTSADWPTDSSGNLVQYSVYLSGSAE